MELRPARHQAAREEIDNVAHVHAHQVLNTAWVRYRAVHDDGAETDIRRTPSSIPLKAARSFSPLITVIKHNGTLPGYSHGRAANEKSSLRMPAPAPLPSRRTRHARLTHASLEHHLRQSERPGAAAALPFRA